MAFNLVEDPETFEAVLDFVDEFMETNTRGTDKEAALIPAMDSLPELKLHVVETESDSVEAAKKETNGSSNVSIPMRKRNYNPNRAREQQRKELLYLREKVVEMEQELKALQEQKTMTTEGVNGNNPQREEVTLFQAPAIWKEMATHQLDERLKSERENRRLKSLLGDKSRSMKRWLNYWRPNCLPGS